MIRASLAGLVAIALISAVSLAQDAATRKVNRAIHAQEKEILRRITTRIEYDKKLDGATVKVEVLPGGAVTLAGSVLNEAAKRWAVELVENTTGVTSVVDQLAVVKTVRVIEAPVVELERPVSVIEVEKPVVVPSTSKVIIRP